jgi:hypothetical protein
MCYCDIYRLGARDHAASNTNLDALIRGKIVVSKEQEAIDSKRTLKLPELT